MYRHKTKEFIEDLQRQNSEERKNVAGDYFSIFVQKKFLK
jgi:hypothetical protein